MSVEDKDLSFVWYRRIGFFPFLVLGLGLVGILLGILLPVLASNMEEVKLRLTQSTDSMLIPALLIGLGLMLVSLFLTMKGLKVLEGHVMSLTEHAFDREVAALMAALRPFADRLEERIGPVLTASQKLAKPLDAVHENLERQGESIQELVATFSQMRTLMSRTREDFVSMQKGKQFEEISKKLEKLSLAGNSGAEFASHFQTLQTKIESVTKTFEEKQREISVFLDSLRSTLSKVQGVEPTEIPPWSETLRTEIQKSQATSNKALEAAQAAAQAAQQAAAAAQAALEAVKNIQLAPAQAAPAAPPAPAKQVFSPTQSEQMAAPQEALENKPENEKETPKVRQKSVLGAIAKLRELRGG